MGLFKKDLSYDKDSVTTGVQELKSSLDCIKDTASNIATQVGKINGAKGFQEYVTGGASLDGSAFAQYTTGCTDAVNQIIEQINAMGQQIEDYNNSKWYEKLGATFAMAGTKFIEGIATFGEQLVDGCATVVGFATGWMNEDWKNSVSEFIQKDHVGDFFYDQYENGALKWVNTHSNMSHTSTGANLFKTAGTIAGYAALTAATGGGTAAMMGIAFTSGTGRKTQQKLQQGDGFYTAALKGFAEGGKDAAIAWGVSKLNQAAASSKAAKTGSAEDQALANVNKQFDKFAKKYAGGDTAKASQILKDIEKGSTNYSDDILRGADKYMKANAKFYATDASELSHAQKLEELAYGTKDTLLKRGMDKVDDFTTNVGQKIGNTAVGQKIQTIGGKIVQSKPVQAVGNAATKATSAIGNSTLANRIGVAVLDHPNAALAIGGTVGAGIATKEQLSATNTSQELFKKNQFDGTRNVEHNLKPVGESPIEVHSDAHDVLKKNEESKTKKSEEERQEISRRVIDDKPLPPAEEDPGDGNNGDDGGQAPSGPSNPSGPGGSSPGGNNGGGGNYRKTEDPPKPTPSPTKTPTPTPTPSTTPTPTPTPSVTPTPTPSVTPSVTPTPTPSTPDQVIDDPGTTPPTPTADTPSGGDTVVHTGGGYTGGGNYTATDPVGVETPMEGVPEDGIENIEGLIDNSEDSIDEIIKKGSNYTKIPSSSTAIKSKSSSGSAVIPIAAGLTAAAAAGIGAKAYLDRKNNNDVGEDEFYGDEWDGDENLEIDYGDSQGEQYLDDDDYGYQATENTESYSARSNDELADIQ